MEYSWFTRLCQFQVYSKVIHLYIYLYSFFFMFFLPNSLFLCYSQAWISVHLRLLDLYFKVSLSCFLLICRCLKPWMLYSILFYIVSFFIGVQLLYTAVSVSVGQQSESATHIHIWVYSYYGNYYCTVY